MVLRALKLLAKLTYTLLFITEISKLCVKVGIERERDVYRPEHDRPFPK